MFKISGHSLHISRLSPTWLYLQSGVGTRYLLSLRYKGSAVKLDNAFKCYDLEDGPPNSVSITRDEAIKMFKQMHEIRRVETACAELYKLKKIRGFCHLYTGEEAVAVGMKSVMRDTDSIITAYRCHGWTMLMGVSNVGMVGELLGFSVGCARGKGGSMHMYAPRFYGGNGIVGAQVPLGTGVGLAHKYSGDGGICFTLYGDGAANQGQVFEAFNIACLLKLPVVFVCENNKYAMGTHVKRGACCSDYYRRGHYIPGIWVDGNQVLAVRSATKFAIEYCLKYGPIVMEMSTYRYMGHSMSDPGTSYRTREEIQNVRRKRDAIQSFKQQLMDMGIAKDDELTKMGTDIRKKVDEEVKKALTDKEVDLKELTADIYADNKDSKVRGIIGYVHNHLALSKLKFAPPVATPKDEIKNVPIGDAALMAKSATEKRTAKTEMSKDVKKSKKSKSSDGKGPKEKK